MILFKINVPYWSRMIKEREFCAIKDLKYPVYNGSIKPILTLAGIKSLYSVFMSDLCSQSFL